MKEILEQILTELRTQNIKSIPRGVAIVTPSDETTFPPSMLYIGTQGDVKVKTQLGDEEVLPSAVGFIPLMVTKVFSTGTDAEGIVRLF